MTVAQKAVHGPAADISTSLGAVHAESSATENVTFTLSGSFTNAGDGGTTSSAALVSLDPGKQSLTVGIGPGSSAVSRSLDPGHYEVFAIAQAIAQVRGTASTESATASAHATVDFTLGTGSSCPSGQVSSVTPCVR